MNSVERFYQYRRLEQEQAHAPDGFLPPSAWPTEGKLEFKDFSFRYRTGGMVLKHLDLTIQAHEKVGIVGRTGAGKSSLLQAIYRMEEPATGTILIDGLDFCKVGLEDLRSHLAIIPQDPTLFMGTLRFGSFNCSLALAHRSSYNLDPFDEHEDEAIWKALEMVQLKQHASLLEGQLQFEVEENGRNFSVGQRQLLCMARALLRNSPILLLDEATASVDVDTGASLLIRSLLTPVDALIQRTVRVVFKHCTVITIAHRLNTIMDSDKILVLDQGRVAEFDSAAALLKKKVPLLVVCLSH